MKYLFFGTALMLTIPVMAQSSKGVSWDVNITEEGIISEVQNNSNKDQICTMEYRVSLLNESGLLGHIVTHFLRPHVI